MSEVCPECKYERPKRDLPPFVQEVTLPGVLHDADCPTLPRLSPEEVRTLNAELAEMDRARRRAWIESQNYFIGGGCTPDPATPTRAGLPADRQETS